MGLQRQERRSYLMSFVFTPLGAALAIGAGAARNSCSKKRLFGPSGQPPGN